jgi:hypothetical protein
MVSAYHVLLLRNNKRLLIVHVVLQTASFLQRLNDTGLEDVINATALVVGDKPGLPGFQAFMSGCKSSDIPIKNQVGLPLRLRAHHTPCVRGFVRLYLSSSW